MASRKKKRAVRSATTAGPRQKGREASTPSARIALRKRAEATDFRQADYRRTRTKTAVLRGELERRTGMASHAATKSSLALARGLLSAMLQERGLNLTPDELHQMVMSAVATLAKTLASSDPSSDLTEAERETLKRGGFDLTSQPSGAHDPLARTVAEYAALRKASKSVAELAKILRVNESRIRQRLGDRPRSLYGFKIDGAWRIPEFLLEGAHLVPGIERVTARLDPDLHPVAFYRWFTTANPDLVGVDAAAEEVGEERPLTPRSWLLAGFDPEPVAELASGL